jgi:hypothetical protein
MMVEQAEPTIWQTASERKREVASFLLSSPMVDLPLCVGYRIGVTIRLASMQNRCLVVLARPAILLE